jgi:Na+/melibiose symporter-like transporter
VHGGLGSSRALASGVAGVLLLALFVRVEARSRHPMLPLSLFRNRQFAGANAATLANYFALGGAFFLLSLELQDALGYSALEAGAALAPSTLIMLVLSPRAGALAQRIGPRLPMTVGPVVAAAGLVLLGRARPGAGYLDTVLPGVVVLGLGITTFVAPLTTAVLGAVDERRAGLASAVNNAAARLAQLLAAAVLPLAASIPAGAVGGGAAFTDGFQRAMWICAGVAVCGGLIAFVTIRGGVEQARREFRPLPGQPCGPAERPQEAA